MQRIDVNYLLDLELPFFEPPNQRRGGWSGVSMVECAGQRFFVKKQKNHTYREPRRFYRPTPTLRREYRNILRFRKLGLVTPSVVLYGERGDDGVLVTTALEDYVDLVSWLSSTQDETARLDFFNELTSQLLRIHEARFHHGCLYGAHIMVKPDSPREIAYLDLESLRRTLRPAHNASKDIGQLFRHTEAINEKERAIIVDAYESRYPGFKTRLATRLTKT
ncbi:MAG: hypothetical protein HUJ31_04335 [Pseudomonadales bacterium]|nr:hypothetical protein [Pseudomonadales bacterium]